MVSGPQRYQEARSRRVQVPSRRRNKAWRVARPPGVGLLCLAIGVFMPSPASAVGLDIDLDHPEFERIARQVEVGAAVRARGLRLEAGRAPVDLLLERFRVFAPGSRVSVHGAGGAYELPAPENSYFRGFVEGDQESLALLTVRASGGVRGLVIRRDGYSVLGAGADARGPAAGLAVRAIDPSEFADRASAFTCSAEGLAAAPEPVGWGGTTIAQPTPRSSHTAPAYSATVAVETDFEYFQLFGDVSDAIDYVGDLFAYLSTLYVSEVDTELEVGSISLWTSAGDPWSQTSSTCRLYEFGRYWNDNRAGEGRTIAHFLSGRASGGVAWLGGLCLGAFNVDHGGSCPGLAPQVDDYGGDYGLSSGIRGNFDVDNPAILWDIFVVAHEIGHNFNSRHSHCYGGIGGETNPVDGCYSGECGRSGCYCGSSSLPSGCPGSGQGCGTVMSYCHTQSGGLGNISWTLGAGHSYGVEPERIPTLMSEHVQQKAAAFPTCIAPGNLPPTALNDAYSGVEGVDLQVPAIGVLANDSDGDADPLTAVLVSNPANGSLSLGADGSFVYTPDAGFSGVDVFKYKANDGTADSGTASVSIDVTPCGGPADLILESQTISTTEIFEACQSITAGPSFAVAGGGDVTFQAGSTIVLKDGFSVAEGAAFAAVTIQ